MQKTHSINNTAVNVAANIEPQIPPYTVGSGGEPIIDTQIQDAFQNELDAELGLDLQQGGIDQQVEAAEHERGDHEAKTPPDTPAQASEETSTDEIPDQAADAKQELLPYDTAPPAFPAALVPEQAQNQASAHPEQSVGLPESDQEQAATTPLDMQRQPAAAGENTPLPTSEQNTFSRGEGEPVEGAVVPTSEQSTFSRAEGEPVEGAVIPTAGDAQSAVATLVAGHQQSQESKKQSQEIGSNPKQGEIPIPQESAQESRAAQELAKTMEAAGDLGKMGKKGEVAAPTALPKPRPNAGFGAVLDSAKQENTPLDHKLAGTTAIGLSTALGGAMTSNEATPTIDIGHLGAEIQSTIDKKSNRLLMKLKPESLGQLQVAITKKNGALSIVVETETAAALRSLEGQFSRLQSQLELQGLNVQHIELRLSEDRQAGMAFADSDAGTQGGDTPQERSQHSKGKDPHANAQTPSLEAGLSIAQDAPAQDRSRLISIRV